MIEKSKIAKYSAVITVVSLIVVAYYVTGVYRNVLEIKKLKKED
jgi:hypothetical protein